MIVRPQEKYKEPFYEASAPIFFSDYAKKVSYLTGHSVEDIMEIVSAFFLVCVDEFLRKNKNVVEETMDQKRTELEMVIPGLGTLLPFIGSKDKYLARFMDFHPTTKIRSMVRKGLFKGIFPMDSIMESAVKDIVDKKQESVVMD